MYYVPDGTKECGFYECKKCGNRFLSLQTMKRIPCPECEAEIDYEIGPDESMEDVFDTAELLEKIVGEEEGRTSQSCDYRWRLQLDLIFQVKLLNGGQDEQTEYIIIEI